MKYITLALRAVSIAVCGILMTLDPVSGLAGMAMAYLLFPRE